jgi:hypothetical protein
MVFYFATAVVVQRRWRKRERVVEEIRHDEPKRRGRQTQIR